MVRPAPLLPPDPLPRLLTLEKKKENPQERGQTGTDLRNCTHRPPATASTRVGTEASSTQGPPVSCCPRGPPGPTPSPPAERVLLATGGHTGATHCMRPSSPLAPGPFHPAVLAVPSTACRGPGSTPRCAAQRPPGGRAAVSSCRGDFASMSPKGGGVHGGWSEAAPLRAVWRREQGNLPPESELQVTERLPEGAQSRPLTERGPETKSVRPGFRANEEKERPWTCARSLKLSRAPAHQIQLFYMHICKCVYMLDAIIRTIGNISVSMCKSVCVRFVVEQVEGGK